MKCECREFKVTEMHRVWVRAGESTRLDGPRVQRKRLPIKMAQRWRCVRCGQRPTEEVRAEIHEHYLRARRSGVI